MPNTDTPPEVDPLARLLKAVERRALGVSEEDRTAYVMSDLAAVNRVLGTIRDEGLAPGPVFCEWGSGLGAICALAAMKGFDAHGIEIRGGLVDLARELATELDLPLVFGKGSFLLPSHRELATVAGTKTQLSYGGNAWDDIGLTPDQCDVVYVYPWPTEEAFMDEVFLRHAKPNALLVTHHARDLVLIQRKLGDQNKLVTLGRER